MDARSAVAADDADAVPRPLDLDAQVPRDLVERGER